MTRRVTAKPTLAPSLSNILPALAAPPAPVLDSFLSKDDLIRLTGLHKGRIRAMVIAGEFPAPVRLTPGGLRVAWLASEVAQWQREVVLNRRVKWSTGHPNPAEERKARTARNAKK